MSSRESGGQERPSRRQDESTESVEEVSAAATDAATEHKAALDSDVDAMLDEIDEVLETNAEEFVRGFVQKGGE